MALRAPNVLALCAGGGGLELGIRRAVPGARTVCAVEIEATAALVLEARMQDESLDPAPLWSDLRTFDGRPWRGAVDLISGGYPCQPFSNAGRRLGDKDPRHLWPDVQRIVSEVQPEWCFFENVGAHLRLGFREVAGSLHSLGYRVAAVLLTAEEVSAPHGRERLFILAHREGILQRESYDEERAQSWGITWRDVGRDSGSVADTGCCGRGPCAEYGGCGCREENADRARQSSAQLADTERSSRSPEPREQHAALRQRGQERAEVSTGAGSVGNPRSVRRWEEGHVREFATGVDRSVVRVCWPPRPGEDWSAIPERLWPATIEPPVRGVADGLARELDLARSDQLHILGNGVVPQQASRALEYLLEVI